MLDIEAIHHVALPVTDLARAKAFYGEVLGLREIARPAFSFAGAWYEVGNGHIHLIVESDQTFRTGKPLNSRDGHVAIRVRSFRAAVEHLESKGYPIRVQRAAAAGFPQIHLMDPDHNMIEINADRAD